MLLSLMRRHAKSYLIKILIGIIAVVFVFYFGYSFRSREGSKIAYVNGELITGVEYQSTYTEMLKSLQREYKDVWSDNLIQVFDLKNRALQSLINEKLVSQEAKQIGLGVTENEIQSQIINNPAFQFKGQFDMNRYQAILNRLRMRPADFEEQISRELLQKKLGQFLMTFLPVSDQEVKDFYRFSHEKVKISFVQFKPEAFKESVTVEKDGLAKFFSENKENYRVPEKVKITYITIDPETYKSKVKMSDQKIREYYEDNFPMFKEEKQVKARHILFKVSEDASEDDLKKAKDRALPVLEKAKKGEDFSDLAEEYSEGPSKEQGGDLGYFSSGQMVKPFEEAVFKLKKGEISDLVRTPFGLHIIKAEDIKEARTKPLEEVHEEIKNRLLTNAGMDLAHEKALSLIDQMPYDVDLNAFASEHEVPVQQTDFFAMNESIPGIGGDSKLTRTVFSLEKNEASDLLEFENTFYIIQVTDKQASYIPDIEDVLEKAKEDYALHLAKKEAVKAAERFLAQLKEGKTWKDLAESQNLEPETSDFITRKDPVPGIGYEEAVTEAAFSLGDEKPYPDVPFETAGGVFVVRWEGYEGIDTEQYEKEKEQYRTTLVTAKQQGLFSEWLDDLKQRAEIEIVRPEVLQ